MFLQVVDEGRGLNACMVRVGVFICGASSGLTVTVARDSDVVGFSRSLWESNGKL